MHWLLAHLQLTWMKSLKYDMFLIYYLRLSTFKLMCILKVRISDVNTKWAGTLMMGVTTLPITDDYPNSHIPNKLSAICGNTWYIKESSVYKNQHLVKDNYCANLNRLIVGDRVGVKICPDRTLRFLINGNIRPN